MSSSGAHGRWAVVGGGFLGMALARGLRRRGQDVRLIESRDHLGGLADAWTIGDTTWDRHYHVVLESDRRVIDLLEDLGLADALEWRTTRTGFFTDGSLHSMSNAWEFLRFPPLDLVSKLRLALTILWCSRIREGEALERIPVDQWLERWSGQRAFERIWRPLLQAKLGDQYRHASAAFIWAIIRRMYSARRQGAKTERLGYVSGGYARVLDRMSRALEEEGVEVTLGARVAGVRRTESDLRLQLEGGDELPFDRVVLTQASPLAARLCPDLTDAEKSAMEGVRYQGVVCESLLIDRPLSVFYVTNITDPWVPFTGVIEMTALVPRSVFGGRSLVYLPRYVAPDDPLFECTDAELERSTIEALERMYEGFSAELDRRPPRVAGPLRARHLDPRLLEPHAGDRHLGSRPLRRVLGPHQQRNAERRRDAAAGGAIDLRPGPGGHRSGHSLVRSAGVERMTERLASVSLDLDDKWSYLKTHGDSSWSELPSYLQLLVPRVLDFLSERGLHITFFVVGRDAERPQNAELLRSIAEHGHEIGNHSYSHEPWFHRYSRERIESELERTEDALQNATGARPRGFRGPGYSLSRTTLELLDSRGYRYDASTLPTFLGPLARLYYLRTTRLDSEEKAERARLFGTFAEGLRPLKPYRWQVGSGRLVELPVTTAPGLRTPFHLSYLIYLRRWGRSLPSLYFRAALELCRLTGTEPSLLLHPLDFLGGEDESALDFFPAMQLDAATKIEVVGTALDQLARHHRIVTMERHVQSFDTLPERAARIAD